jgi:ribosomal protein L7/L12
MVYDALQDVTPDVREALERGEYVLAIKKLRETTGLALKEAKEQVDELRLRREKNA